MDKQILIKIRNYCAYQERCHSEVRYKLVALGARGLELENYIVHLINEGFLNEQRFARVYAGSKFRMLKWGKTKIIIGLKQKQVSAACIKKAIQEIDDDSYEQCAQRLMEAKYRSFRSSTLTAAHKQKILQYMLQKGYEQSLVFKLMKRLH